MGMSNRTDYTSFSNRSRADISMAHDNLAVTISSEVRWSDSSRQGQS